MSMAIEPLNAFEHSSEARMVLSGFRHLYETQLKAERKSAKTIAVYHYALTKFEKWWDEIHEEPAVLAGFTALNVRLFLVAAQSGPSGPGTPTWTARRRRSSPARRSTNTSAA
jgi:hypothetical protein